MFIHPKREIKKCELCEGKGIIYVWRSDLEDFDLIICPECNEPED
jgi:hypothetical protein